MKSKIFALLLIVPMLVIAGCAGDGKKDKDYKKDKKDKAVQEEVNVKVEGKVEEDKSEKAEVTVPVSAEVKGSDSEEVKIDVEGTVEGE